jgi:hypothetical protein
MNAMLEANMVVARIQGPALFAHARVACADEFVMRLHGSDDTGGIYLTAAAGWAFGVEVNVHSNPECNFSPTSGRGTNAATVGIGAYIIKYIVRIG